MAQRVVIPGFRKIETSGSGEGGTGNYNDLTNKPSINNVPLVGNLNTVDLKLTDATLTKEGVPAEAKTVGDKLEAQSTSLTALSEQLGSHTVKSDVPENAVFTDTVYDDTEVQKRISDNGYGEVAGGKNIISPNCYKLVNYWVGSGESEITSNYGQTCLFVPVEAGKTYVYTSSNTSIGFGGCCFANANKESINVSACTYANSNSPQIITVPISASYFVIGSYKSNINYQLEEGTTATEYEPYFPSNRMLAEENSQQSTEIMDIKMLGWSVPKECPVQNEVNGNQFVQKVGRVDLGTLDWVYDAVPRFYTSGLQTFVNPVKSETDIFLGYLKGYTNLSLYDLFYGTKDKAIAESTKGTVSIKDTSYTDATAFKIAMQGQYLYYELATPITTTIDGNEIGKTVSDVRKETTVNLLNPTLQTTTSNGVTCTNNGDGTYTLKGTASDNTAISIQGIKVDKQKKI